MKGIERIPGNIRAIREAISELLDVFSPFFQDTSDAIRVKICLFEALANAFIHGNAQDPQKRIRVRWEADGGHGDFWVSDEGPGIPPDLLQPGNSAAEKEILSENGRGLSMIRKTANRLELLQDGKELFFGFDWGKTSDLDR
ncbi:MAG TPA: ATP-binding protein [Thermotogota bacterium]|nr:ATP-binding protein [Thermotogota bacterium]